MARTRLLLAEDHQEMRAVITRILEREYEVVGAVGNGQALLEAEPQLKPDICLLDISMPILSGIEAALRLRERGSVAKVIFLTAHAEAVFLEAAMEAGALGYVLKARMVSDLRVAIREAMAGRRFVSPPALMASLSTRNGH